MNDSFPFAIARYRAALPPGRVSEFALTDADRLGVPCWSVVFHPENGPHKGGVGYGETDSQALCGAWGELTEDFRAHHALEKWPLTRASFAQMRAQYGPRGVVNPLALCLEAGSSYHLDIELDWVEIARLGEGEKVWIPIEFVACGWSDLSTPGNSALGDRRRGRLVTPITNGLGAGLDFEQAVSHGLLELLQRDGNGLAIRALATGRALDLETVSDPLARDLLARYDAAGVDVVVKIASTERGLTSFYVCGLDRDASHLGANVMALAGGEATHPDATVALRKALLEFASSRARIAFFHGPIEIAERVAPPGYLDAFRASFRTEDEESRALESLKAWSQLPFSLVRKRLMARVQRVDETVSFNELPSRAMESKKQLIEFLTQMLRAEGSDILVADFSSTGVFAVKMIVPGLEVETLSYGRIGARNVARLIRNGESMAGVGPKPAGALDVRLVDEEREKLGGAAWFDARAVDELVSPLYALYREPGRHAVAFLDDEGR